MVPRFMTAVLALTVAACGSGSENAVEIAHVHGLGIAGDVLFVATHEGLYVHEDGEWSQRSQDSADHMGFTLISEDLMFRSGHPEGGGNLGVQRSTDGGRTWTTVSKVLESEVDFHAMAGGGEPLALYGWMQMLFRSVGDPAQWEPLRSTDVPQAVGSIAVADATGDVYLSTSEGLRRSTDQGETWTAVGERLVFALAVSENGETIFASNPERPEVLRSSDGGETWTMASSGLSASETIVALASSPDGRNVAAAEASGTLWWSEDGAQTWSAVPTPS